MNEQCTQIEEALSDFLEGSLPPDAAAAFSAHLDACPDCAGLVSQVRDLTSRMRALGAVSEPPFLARRIVVATLGLPETGWRRWFTWPSVIWQPQFAMGAVTVVASFLILLHATAGKTGNLALADLNPATVVRAADRRVHLAYAHGVRFVNDLRFVYDIESRLAAPEPTSEPAHPQDPAPSLDPRQKSKVVPREDRDIHDARALTAALEAGLSDAAYFQRSTHEMYCAPRE